MPGKHQPAIPWRKTLLRPPFCRSDLKAGQQKGQKLRSPAERWTLQTKSTSRCGKLDQTDEVIQIRAIRSIENLIILLINKDLISCGGAPVAHVKDKLIARHIGRRKAVILRRVLEEKKKELTQICLKFSNWVNHANEHLSHCESSWFIAREVKGRRIENDGVILKSGHKVEQHKDDQDVALERSKRSYYVTDVLKMATDTATRSLASNAADAWFAINHLQIIMLCNCHLLAAFGCDNNY